MKSQVTLQSVLTGVIMVLPFEEHGEGNVYHWTEGNNSCDCNREVYFPDEAQTEKCSTNRFKLISIRDELGKPIHPAPGLGGTV